MEAIVSFAFLCFRFIDELFCTVFKRCNVKQQLLFTCKKQE
jgi:hypothetical protein